MVKSVSHRTSILLAAAALTTDRSMFPKDLIQNPREKTQRTGTEPKEPLRQAYLLAKNPLTETAV
jgi:hypothetical protein